MSDDLSESMAPGMRCDSAGFDAGLARQKVARKPRAKKAGAKGARAVVAGVAGENAAQPSAAPDPDNDDAGMPAADVYLRIGHLTRTLHNALRELGYDKELAGTRDQLPDARDRLAYIARVTGEAAEKVLNAVDRARTVQEDLTHQAESLRTRWQALAVYTANGSGRATPAGRQLVDETCQFFASVGGQTDATNSILTDIMMAQDFHDLTGQVIRKVVALAQSMEEQLLRLLLETTPPEQRRRIECVAAPGSTERLEGPVVNSEGRDDVVADQAGVDDLLATLGF